MAIPPQTTFRHVGTGSTCRSSGLLGLRLLRTALCFMSIFCTLIGEILLTILTLDVLMFLEVLIELAKSGI